MIVLTMSGCAVTVEPPAISDISNADSIVRVQARNAGNYWVPKWPEDQAILEQGEKGCELFNKSAVMLSFRCVEVERRRSGAAFNFCRTREYLFACKI